ncbi:MAG: hypothetical protein JKY48_20610 [Flavobacteriales bacterium]|nr:hypothetical protein [Flavobacteriales bacterium]
MISGSKIYIYDVNQITTDNIEANREDDEIHVIKVTVNPMSQLRSEVLIGNANHVSIQLIKIQGGVL